jgi:uncharacterized protein YlaI
MSNSEVKLVFTAHFQVNGDGETAIENAIEKARDEYGSEVAEYGEFTITGSIRTGSIKTVKDKPLQPVYMCPYCGDKTSNPEDRLIQYPGFHLGCKGKRITNE